MKNRIWIWLVLALAAFTWVALSGQMFRTSGVASPVATESSVGATSAAIEAPAAVEAVAIEMPVPSGDFGSPPPLVDSAHNGRAEHTVKPPATGPPAVELPAEAYRTIALIQKGGPFPHRQDGTVFGNRERLLPRKPRGWYREYTVETPGLHHRGARRIVTGGEPIEVWYYTDDHYQSFRRFTP